jgi:bifunctional DNA-binding transcriptional regulator/antitoxin component of YhaV-PrlF toxin-antitoxin module
MEEENLHNVGSTERGVFVIGRSLAVTLPKGFVETHGIKKGDKVLLTYDSFILLETVDKERIMQKMQKRKDIFLKKKLQKGGGKR